MEEKPYRLPDPEKQPESFLVLVYKTLKSIPFDDRGWDKIFYPRCMKRTKQLLENLNNDVRMATQCMQDLKEKFEADGLSWTIETMLTYCFEWRAEHTRTNDRDCMRNLVGAYSKTTAGKWLRGPEQRKPFTPALSEPTAPPSRSDLLMMHGQTVQALKKCPTGPTCDLCAETAEGKKVIASAFGKVVS